MRKVFPEVLDPSRLMTFQRCQRRYWWRYVERLVPEVSAAAPDFGAAMHKALLVWYETHEPKRALDALCAEWQDRSGDSLHTLQVGAQILAAYIQRYREEPFEVLSLERKFDAPVPGCDVELRVRTDMHVRWAGRIYAVDHKTTSRLGYNFFDQFKPHYQMAAYTLASKWLYEAEAEPVMGVLVNAILVAKTKQEFARHPVHYNDAELAHFAFEFAAVAMDLQRVYEGGFNEAKPNWTSCGDWGGCAYRTLCLAYMEGGMEAVGRMRSEYRVDEHESEEEGE